MRQCLRSAMKFHVGVKIGSGNQIYCEAEVQSRSVKKRKLDSQSQIVTLTDEPQSTLAAANESGLRRGLANAEQTKFRVTCQAAQAVLRYFEPGAEPVGVVVRGLLVVIFLWDSCKT